MNLSNVNVLNQKKQNRVLPNTTKQNLRCTFDFNSSNIGTLSDLNINKNIYNVNNNG